MSIDATASAAATVTADHAIAVPSVLSHVNADLAFRNLQTIKIILVAPRAITGGGNWCYAFDLRLAPPAANAVIGNGAVGLLGPEFSMFSSIELTRVNILAALSPAGQGELVVALGRSAPALAINAFAAPVVAFQAFSAAMSGTIALNYELSDTTLFGREVRAPRVGADAPVIYAAVSNGPAAGHLAHTRFELHLTCSTVGVGFIVG